MNRAAAAALLVLPAAAQARPEPRYDFSGVTTLSQGAIKGQNVLEPVPGFEILLMKDGATVYRQSFGTWFNGRVANADSATKTLSGALVMAVTDNSPNPFSLDTRLSDYIPEFDGLARFVTVRQAFSHTSGMAGSNVMGDETLTLQQAALEIAALPMARIPGETFDYGGTSMHATGAVVERAAGDTWNNLFTARIAGPLGLTATRYVLTTPSNPRIAGGAESTAPEFARFMEMLRRGGEIDGVRVLSQTAVDQLFTRQTALDVRIISTPLDGVADYGVGVWLDQRDSAGTLIGAVAAGARGFTCWVDFDDGIVGTIATDLTYGENIRQYMYMLRDAAQNAIRNPFCPADLNEDRAVTSQDFFAFLAAFFAGDADFNTDGATDSQDFFDFLTAFFTPC